MLMNFQRNFLEKFVLEPVAIIVESIQAKMGGMYKGFFRQHV